MGGGHHHRKVVICGVPVDPQHFDRWQMPLVFEVPRRSMPVVLDVASWHVRTGFIAPMMYKRPESALEPACRAPPEPPRCDEPRPALPPEHDNQASAASQLPSRETFDRRRPPRSSSSSRDEGEHAPSHDALPSTASKERRVTSNSAAHRTSQSTPFERDEPSRGATPRDVDEEPSSASRGPAREVSRDSESGELGSSGARRPSSASRAALSPDAVCGIFEGASRDDRVSEQQTRQTGSPPAQRDGRPSNAVVSSHDDRTDLERDEPIWDTSRQPRPFNAQFTGGPDSRREPRQQQRRGTRDETARAVAAAQVAASAARAAVVRSVASACEQARAGHEGRQLRRTRRTLEQEKRALREAVVAERARAAVEREERSRLQAIFEVTQRQHKDHVDAVRKLQTLERRPYEERLRVAEREREALEADCVRLERQLRRERQEAVEAGDALRRTYNQLASQLVQERCNNSAEIRASRRDRAKAVAVAQVAAAVARSAVLCSPSLAAAAAAAAKEKPETEMMLEKPSAADASVVVENGLPRNPPRIGDDEDVVDAGLRRDDEDVVDAGLRRDDEDVVDAGLRRDDDEEEITLGRWRGRTESGSPVGARRTSADGLLETAAVASDDWSLEADERGKLRAAQPSSDGTITLETREDDDEELTLETEPDENPAKERHSSVVVVVVDGPPSLAKVPGGDRLALETEPDDIIINNVARRRRPSETMSSLDDDTGRSFELRVAAPPVAASVDETISLGSEELTTIRSSIEEETTTSFL